MTSKNNQQPKRRSISIQDILQDIEKYKTYSQHFARASILGYKNLIKEYETTTNRTLIVYNGRDGITDQDISYFDNILKNHNSIDKLDLMINSPGGSGEVAETIVEMCRSFLFPKGGEFRVIVPEQAKSAATLIALGSDEIVMGYSSELGPIDPQKYIIVNGVPQRISVISLIKARDRLLKNISSAQPGEDVRGYLSQLSRSSADPAFIEQCYREILFANDLVMQWLPQYMLRDLKDESEKIKKAKNIVTSLTSFLFMKKQKMFLFKKERINLYMVERLDQKKHKIWV